jgi:tryptophan-rich sensory protein
MVTPILFAFGYPAAVVVIARWLPVVRERRARWFVVHHVGVIAIVAGWAIEQRWPAVAVNSTWLVASSLWYVLGGRSRRD